MLHVELTIQTYMWIRQLTSRGSVHRSHVPREQDNSIDREKSMFPQAVNELFHVYGRQHIHQVASKSSTGYISGPHALPMTERTPACI